MNEAQQARCLELARRGFSVEMIFRTVKSDTDSRTRRSTIKNLLEAAGIGTLRDAPPEHMELQKWEDNEILRKRWAKLLPGIKEKLRAEARGNPRGWL